MVCVRVRTEVIVPATRPIPPVSSGGRGIGSRVATCQQRHVLVSHELHVLGLVLWVFARQARSHLRGRATPAQGISGVQPEMVTGLLTNQLAFLVANSLSPPAFNLFNPPQDMQGRPTHFRTLHGIHQLQSHDFGRRIGVLRRLAQIDLQHLSLTPSRLGLRLLEWGQAYGIVRPCAAEMIAPSWRGFEAQVRPG
jgi:hypothetical protein